MKKSIHVFTKYFWLKINKYKYQNEKIYKAEYNTLVEYNLKILFKNIFVYRDKNWPESSLLFVRDTNSTGLHSIKFSKKQLTTNNNT